MSNVGFALLIEARELETFNKAITDKFTTEEILNHLDEQEYHHGDSLEEKYKFEGLYQEYLEKHYPLLDVSNFGKVAPFSNHGFAVYIDATHHFVGWGDDLNIVEPTVEEINQLQKFKEEFSLEGTMGLKGWKFEEERP